MITGMSSLTNQFQASVNDPSIMVSQLGTIYGKSVVNSNMKQYCWQGDFYLGESYGYYWGIMNAAYVVNGPSYNYGFAVVPIAQLLGSTTSVTFVGGASYGDGISSALTRVPLERTFSIYRGQSSLYLYSTAIQGQTLGSYSLKLREAQLDGSSITNASTLFTANIPLQTGYSNYLAYSPVTSIKRISNKMYLAYNLGSRWDADEQITETFGGVFVSDIGGSYSAPYTIGSSDAYYMSAVIPSVAYGTLFGQRGAMLFVEWNGTAYMLHYGISIPLYTRYAISKESAIVPLIRSVDLYRLSTASGGVYYERNLFREEYKVPGFWNLSAQIPFDHETMNSYSGLSENYVSLTTANPFSLDPKSDAGTGASTGQQIDSWIFKFSQSGIGRYRGLETEVASFGSMRMNYYGFYGSTYMLAIGLAGTKDSGSAGTTSFITLFSGLEGASMMAIRYSNANNNAFNITLANT